MTRHRIEVGAVLGVLLALVSGCSSSDGDDGMNKDGGPADLAPSPDRGAPPDVFIGDVDLAALTLEGFPAAMRSYPGANALLLAELKGNRGFNLDLMLTSDPEKLPLKLFPIDDGDRTLFEVLLVPLTGQVGKTVKVTLSLADRVRSVVREATWAVEVIAEAEAPPEPPAGLRDRFVAYLAKSQAGLGITESTDWDSVAGVVGPADRPATDETERHWIYTSSTWELGLSWSTEPAPDDGASIYLRRRSERAPSFAASLPSRANTAASISEQAPPAEPIR